MKALVAIKRVVDFNVKVRIKADGSGVDTDQLKMSMNPFDEIAVEEAIRLKEKGLVNEIVVVSIGTLAAQETLRQALALGADRAILIKIDRTLEPLNIAKLLCALIRKEEVTLAILGKQAIDDDCNQTGQMLAALLNWPQGTFISELSVDTSKNIITVSREIDGGMETLQLQLPAVITTDLRLNQPRFPTLPNMMKSKSKPMLEYTPEALGVNLEKHLEILQVSVPSARQAGIKVKDIKNLMLTLKEKCEGVL